MTTTGADDAEKRPRARAWLPHVFLLACLLAAALAPAACLQNVPLHEREDVKSQPCVSCHQGAYDAAKNPVHTNVMPTTCEQCHSTRAWSPPQLAHHDGFPLQNKHANVACVDCHTKGYGKNATPKECVACHQKDYDGATKPKHAGFPSDCKVCHSDLGWRPSIFVHPWALTGVHASTPCASCHKGNPPAYKGTPTDCVGCHQKDYDDSKNPMHAGLPATCITCHTTNGWRPSTYVHPWALEGAHATTPCGSCHTGSPPRYAGTPKDCVGCHLADYTNSTYPGHATFPKTCPDCHVMTAWRPALSGLHPEAKFPLTAGAHSDPKIRCRDCHNVAGGASTGGQNTDCIHCHLQAHQRPTIDAKHTLVPGYLPSASAAPLNFCLGCHPMGKKN